MIGLSAPAGAVNNNPVGNPTSPAVSYELDCTGTGAAAGETAPFIAVVVMNTSTDNGLPTGTTFGASGSVSLVLSGAIVAPANAALDPATVGLQGDLTFGSTDGSATGTYAYTSPAMTQPNPGGQVLGVSWWPARRRSAVPLRRVTSVKSSCQARSVVLRVCRRVP